MCQRKTRCTGPRLGTRSVVRFWTTYVNHAESELFETRCISVQYARFRQVSSSYLRSAYHPRYETMEIPLKGTETAVRMSWFRWPIERPFFGNKQRTAKPLRPTKNVAWTMYVVHGRNTYSETSLLRRGERQVQKAVEKCQTRSARKTLLTINGFSHNLQMSSDQCPLVDDGDIVTKRHIVQNVVDVHKPSEKEESNTKRCKK